jgi:DNA-binding NarL/FixJ family response regulator
MCRALIADDNADFRQTLRQTLARHFPFMQIEEAGDGEQALDQGLAERHEFVFLDVKMPGHNGLDVARSLRGHDPHASVCIVTGHDLPEYREAAQASGVDHFVPKAQFSDGAIATWVRSVLNGRLKTLIIEDDAECRARLRDLLLRRWPTMILAEAAGGAQGLRDAASLAPDLLLVDLWLPSGDGPDVLTDPDIRPPSIVAVAPADLPEYRDAAARYGVAYFVFKDEDIAESLGRLFGGKFSPDSEAARR